MFGLGLRKRRISIAESRKNCPETTRLASMLKLLIRRGPKYDVAQLAAVRFVIKVRVLLYFVVKYWRLFVEPRNLICTNGRCIVLLIVDGNYRTSPT